MGLMGEIQLGKELCRTTGLDPHRIPAVAPASVGEGTGDDTSSVQKQGWLLKRADIGVWQRRYFIISDSALVYMNRAPATSSSGKTLPTLEEGEGKKGFLAIGDLHDVHPTGNAGGGLSGPASVRWHSHS